MSAREQGTSPGGAERPRPGRTSNGSGQGHGPLRVAIVGGTGYGAMEFLRLSLDHPVLEVATLTSRTHTGRVDALHPHLRGFTSLAFTAPEPEALADDHDLLVFATPAGVAARHAGAALARNERLKVLDLSGDFRLPDAAAYEQWYGRPHADVERLGTAAYGLPECGRRDEIAAARLIANPGCHATAVTLALWPLLAAGLPDGLVAATSVTGSSGAGATPGAGSHHPERFANYRAYKPLLHQHVPEIERALGGDVRLAFTAHSGPFARGIYATVTAPLREGGEEQVAAAYRRCYGGEPLVRLVDGPPELRAVAGSCLADVGVVVGRGVAVAMVALDNLGKGMAGTALQNANLAFGLPETTGLLRPAPGP